MRSYGAHFTCQSAHKMILCDMGQTELQLKKKIQIVVASCLTLFFVLVTVLVFQFAIRINQDNQIYNLQQENAALQRQIDRAQLDTNYFLSDQFRIDFIMRRR